MPVTTTTDTTPAQPGDGEHVGALRARGGFKDKPILWVLMISMVLVVMAFGVAFMSNWSREASLEQGSVRVNEPAAAALFNEPASAPRVIESN